MLDQAAGTITFLFTDIEGSTRLWEQHPDAMKSSLERHDSLLRDVIERHHGRVFKTIGDAFCASFSSAPDALAAALAAQKALTAESWPEPIGSIHVRMAVHTGTAVERDGDYFGPPLNRVARLLAAGHGGQTLISLATQELVRDQLPSSASLLDLGEHRLKDLFRPERIFQLNAPDLPAEFPPLRTLEGRRTNLPAQPTAFVGRERELAAVLTLIRRPDVRLVTLTGVGGTGKTRLSLQVAADLLDEYEHGVFFVELATITDPNAVIPKVASTLGVKEVSGQPIEQTLQTELHDKHMLLVLDNLEQVVEAAPMIGDLLAGTSTLKIITSSREKLHLRAEHEVTIPPLGLPNIKKKETVAVVSQYEAVALFIQRAKAASDRWEITDDNAPAVAEICVRLDGLPLAIELAAARSKILAPQAILEKLSSRLKALTGGARDLPARQQTIRGMIDWSYDLLDEDEKTLFSRMGVFVGGCTLEAAEAICAESLPLEVSDGLESLVDKSLIRLTEDVAGQTRFMMLETIREYAAERLSQSGDAEAIRERHAQFFVALAEQIEPELKRPRQVEYLTQLEPDLDNFRAVDDRAFEKGEPEAALRLGAALERFWRTRGGLTEGRHRLSRSVEKAEEQPTRLFARAIHSLGAMAQFQGERNVSQPLFDKAISLFRSLGDKQGLSWSLLLMGNNMKSQNDADGARAAYTESAALARETGDRRLLSSNVANLALMELDSLQGDLTHARAQLEELIDEYRDIVDPINIALFTLNIGYTFYYQGDYESARVRLMGAQAISQEVGWPAGIRESTLSIGLIAMRTGEFARARELFGEALTASVQMDNRADMLYGFLSFGTLAANQQQPHRAARLWGAFETLLPQVGYILSPREQDEFERDFAVARAQLEPAEFERAQAEGQALSLDEAVQLALSPY